MGYREDMSSPEEEEGGDPSPVAPDSRASQWSRTALAMSALFASLPVASRVFLGSWEFEGAAAISCLCLAVGAYYYLLSRRSFRTVPDPASMLDQALRLAMAGRTDEAAALLTEAIRLSPEVWQAFQYRGELSLGREGGAPAAIRDFSDAIRLAPGEALLYALRSQAHFLMGDNASARDDYERATALSGEIPPPAEASGDPTPPPQ